MSPNRRWLEYLAAILLGNAVYLIVTPFLPHTLRHKLFTIDLGLAVDFLICAAIFGLIRWRREG